LVELDSRIYMILEDHERRHMGIWMLNGDRWVDVSGSNAAADALFNGRVVSRAYVGTLPPLPAFE
jgi:hypothetical protein